MQYHQKTPAKKVKPRVLINIDQGVVWSAHADIEIELIVENIDCQMVRKIPVHTGDYASKKIDDLQELAECLEIDQFEAIRIVNKHKEKNEMPRKR